MLILEGFYTMKQNGPRFQRVGAPDPQALARLLSRLVRSFTRGGLLVEDPEQPWLELEPADTIDSLLDSPLGERLSRMAEQAYEIARQYR